MFDLMTEVKRIMKDEKPLVAVNWTEEDPFLSAVWNQQWNQIWFPEEFAVSKDKKVFNKFAFRQTFARVLGGLTLLDTLQTNVGMNLLSNAVRNNIAKALYSVFGAFEAIHAKSYSYIFTTLLTQREIDDVFEWVETNEYLQTKGHIIEQIYKDVNPLDTVSIYKSHVASVFLESFLFYSGFFYPLFLGGQGILRTASEVISVILRDENIHGVTIGYQAQQLRQELTAEQLAEVDAWTYELLGILYDNEMKYTNDLYKDADVLHHEGEKGAVSISEVKAFVRYNANKALMNLGLEKMFPEEPINEIVQNGIRNDITTYDFFSQKGATYAKATVEPITKDSFNLEETEAVFDNFFNKDFGEETQELTLG